MEDTQMTIEQAIQAVNDYRDRTGKTQTAIATELGISSGALSSFLSGTYKTPHTIVPKVHQLLALQEKKAVAPKAPAFMPTSISDMVMTTITYCHLQGKIGVVYGDAGVGKTEAICEYLRQNSLAICITISPSFASMSVVNELLSEQLGIRETVSRKIYREAVAKLRGSGRVLIVDEAQHLTSKTLDHIRCLCDESGIGVVFVGNEDVYRRLRGTGKADFAQLYSRIGFRRPVTINHIKKDDIKAVFGESGLDEETIDILYRISHTNYGLRGAVNVFVNTVAVFSGLINAASLAKMAKEMNIG